jgi:hypothetical protein
LFTSLLQDLGSQKSGDTPKRGFGAPNRLDISFSCAEKATKTSGVTGKKLGRGPVAPQDSLIGQGRLFLMSDQDRPKKKNSGD